jgi:rfaE bifunctional protein nucleotidyltransferase chain/domain
MRIEEKMKTREEAQKQMRAWQNKGEKVVFTNGCFDLLHKGHVLYLEAAKALGDKMVVAVNGDASVSRLKGPRRPIQNLEGRMTVLAALASVDLVVSFDEDTPLGLIEFLKPNILAKGGDWRIEDIVGGKEVIEWGGEVHSITFHDGFSTTRIVEKIKDHENR